MEVVFILAILYIPSMHGFFSTGPLPLWVWGIIMLSPWVIFGIEELRKLAVRRGVHWLAA